MIRKFLNSMVELIDMTIVKGLDDSRFYIQNEKINDNLQFIEHCGKNEICDLIPFTANNATSTTKSKPQFDNDKILDYSQTILNNDPFYKYSGQPLGAIIDAKDINWINRALKEMRNEYIKERIEYLAKASGLI